MREFRRRLMMVETGVKVNNNGYDYIDLGLPSGALWAARNIGASTNYDYGDSYKWGTTVAGDNGTPNYSITTRLTNTPYDTAAVLMGGDWKMPTKEQWAELVNTCTCTYETDYNNSGINGCLVVGPNGSSIFLPAKLNAQSYGYWATNAKNASDAYYAGGSRSKPLFAGGNYDYDAKEKLKAIRGVLQPSTGLTLSSYSAHIGPDAGSIGIDTILYVDGVPVTGVNTSAITVTSNDISKAYWDSSTGTLSMSCTANEGDSKVTKIATITYNGQSVKFKILQEATVELTADPASYSMGSEGGYLNIHLYDHGKPINIGGDWTVSLSSTDGVIYRSNTTGYVIVEVPSTTSSITRTVTITVRNGSYTFDSATVTIIQSAATEVSVTYTVENGSVKIEKYGLEADNIYEPSSNSENNDPPEMNPHTLMYDMGAQLVASWDVVRTVTYSNGATTRDVTHKSFNSGAVGLFSTIRTVYVSNGYYHFHEDSSMTINSRIYSLSISTYSDSLRLARDFNSIGTGIFTVPCGEDTWPLSVGYEITYDYKSRNAILVATTVTQD